VVVGIQDRGLIARRVVPKRGYVSQCVGHGRAPSRVVVGVRRHVVVRVRGGQHLADGVVARLVDRRRISPAARLRQPIQNVIGVSRLHARPVEELRAVPIVVVNILLIGAVGIVGLSNAAIGVVLIRCLVVEPVDGGDLLADGVVDRLRGRTIGISRLGQLTVGVVCICGRKGLVRATRKRTRDALRRAVAVAVILIAGDRAKRVGSIRFSRSSLFAGERCELRRRAQPVLMTRIPRREP